MIVINENSAVMAEFFMHNKKAGVIEPRPILLLVSISTQASAERLPAFPVPECR